MPETRMNRGRLPSDATGMAMRAEVPLVTMVPPAAVTVIKPPSYLCDIRTPTFPNGESEKWTGLFTPIAGLGRCERDRNHAGCAGQRACEVNPDGGASRDFQVAGRGGQRERLNRVGGALEVVGAGMQRGARRDGGGAGGFLDDCRDGRAVRARHRGPPGDAMYHVGAGGHEGHFVHAGRVVFDVDRDESAVVNIIALDPHGAICVLSELRHKPSKEKGPEAPSKRK